jgi:DNA-binding transcriptional ArsR family regulator
MKRAIQKRVQRGSEGFEESMSFPARKHTLRLKPGAEGCRSVAILAKGLSDENRLRILMCLTGQKKSVSKIVEEVGLSQPLVSHHLKELKRCLIVDIERNGPFIYYGLADSRILGVVQALRSIAMDLLSARKTL